MASIKPTESEWDTDNSVLFLLESLHPDWHADAACRGMDPKIFYPEQGGYSTLAANVEAQATCDGCPVREQCGEQGARDEYGVWGGRRPEERRMLRRRRSVSRV